MVLPKRKWSQSLLISLSFTWFATKISLKALVAGKQLPAPWLQEIIFLPVPSFFITTENGLPTKMHFLNLPAILHFKLTNFLPLPAQELVVFPLNISGFLAYFSCCVILELGLCFQAGNRLGSHFGGTGRQEVALAMATNELNDNGDLKASDFYLNSLKFQELWRYSAQTQTSQLFFFSLLLLFFARKILFFYSRRRFCNYLRCCRKWSAITSGSFRSLYLATKSPSNAQPAPTQTEEWALQNHTSSIITLSPHFSFSTKKKPRNHIPHHQNLTHFRVLRNTCTLTHMLHLQQPRCALLSVSHQLKYTDKLS